MSTKVTIETTVRTLSQMKEAAAKGEVSFSAYEHARNLCADVNTDHDWWDCTVETWKNALAEIGFLDADIRFSGFWSQGDGASFTASIDAEKIISLFVAPPAPLDQISVDADEKEVFAPWLMRKVGESTAARTSPPCFRLQRTGSWRSPCTAPRGTTLTPAP